MTAVWVNGRCGQALAVGIAVLALALTWLGLVAPLRSWFDGRAALLTQRLAVLREMRDVAATLPRLRALPARDHDGSGAAMTGVVPGASDALAAAELQDRVQRWAAANGASLATVDTMPVVAAGDWHKVGLRISLNAPWPVLMALLRSIEDSLVLVDDIHFHSAGMVTRSAGLSIQASMVLYGFRSVQVEPGT